MTPFPEIIEKFVAELAASCPPGYELDEMSLDRSGATNNSMTVTVWWKPVASPRGD